MHLYALDEKENIIPAHQANKKTDYFCRECRNIVRCRGGLVRHIHFYHLEPNRACRQSGKSIIHWQIQYYLEKILQDCELEKRFHSCNRIADVVYEKEKLIFEIQCSPITAREIEERNRDYQDLGYRVVWILHDGLYNRHRLTAAEYFLQEAPHYFTDINAEGIGQIYDQWDVLVKGKRVKNIGIREVQISSHRINNGEFFDKSMYPKWLLKRIQTWPLYFSGDYIDFLLMQEESQRLSFLSARADEEKKLIDTLIDKPKHAELWRIFIQILNAIAFPYRLSLYLLMDRLTR